MSMLRRSCLLNAVLLALPSLLVSPASLAADSFPSKAIEVVVPWPPGGGSDSVGRAVAEAGRSQFSQPLLVINKPGASGTIGFSYVTAAPADGHKAVLLTPEVILAPLMGIGRSSPGDFRVVARLTDDPLAITVRADAPWNTIEEFLAYGKANPEKLTISTAGNGTTHQVGAVALEQSTAIRFTTIPYQGSAPAIMGVLNGEVMATTAAYAELNQHVIAGKLKTLAVMADKRIAALPQVPTMKERGYNLSYSTWRAIAVHKSTPQSVIDQWSAASVEISKSPAFVETMKKLALTPAYADGTAFNAELARQAQDYQRLLSSVKPKE